MNNNVINLNTIIAREKPSVTIIPEGKLEVLAGSGAYFSCRVTGSPLPTIEWRRRDGQALPINWEESKSYPGEVT